MFGSTPLRELLDKGDEKEVKSLLSKVNVIGEFDPFPPSPKKGDLIKVENDYNVVVLFEHDGENWKEFISPKVASILNLNQGSSFKFMLDNKPKDASFQANVSDKAQVRVSIVHTSFKEQDMQDAVNERLKSLGLTPDNLVNVAVYMVTNEKCILSIFYKY
ncbi:MAG: hypothetical protein PHN38_03000 [Sulfurospirillaceae bacterium]|nr:hypothetical protein [Sulfurospirillaceae bacterium]MDD3462326.1 hypothetical protein [Sulfurospirillaceae bacterium]